MSKPSTRASNGPAPRPPVRGRGPRLPILPSRYFESLYRACRSGVRWRLGLIAALLLAGGLLLAIVVLNERPARRGEALAVAGPAVAFVALALAYPLARRIPTLRLLARWEVEAGFELAPGRDGAIDGVLEVRSLGIIPALTARLVCERAVRIPRVRRRTTTYAITHAALLFEADRVALDSAPWRRSFALDFPAHAPRDKGEADGRYVSHAWFIELRLWIDDKRSSIHRLPIQTT